MPYQDLTPSADETLERLIAMTNQTNLVALNKSLACIKQQHTSYVVAAERLSNLGSRMLCAVHEVGMTLPPHQRALA